jgi:hypothetical protein
MLAQQLNRRFTEWMLPIASGANAASTRLDGGSLGGALLLGGVLGFVWSPCSGPLLASALTLVASEGGAVRGGIILGLFGIGAAIPLVAVAYASRGGFNAARGWVQQCIDGIRKAFGVFMHRHPQRCRQVAGSARRRHSARRLGRGDHPVLTPRRGANGTGYAPLVSVTVAKNPGKANRQLSVGKIQFSHPKQRRKHHAPHQNH